MDPRTRSHQLGQLVTQTLKDNYESGRSFVKRAGINWKTFVAFRDGEAIPAEITRHKIEDALNWRTGILYELIHNNQPLDGLTADDLTEAAQERPKVDTSDLSDADLLAELAYRLRDANEKLASLQKHHGNIT